MNYYENEIVELKLKVTSDLKKEIVAFANTNGGTIYIGVDDDGSVKGLENIKDSLEVISNMIHDAIKPDLTMLTSLSVLEEDNKSIIVLRVLKGNKKPYYLSEKGLKPSGVYIRHGVVSTPSTEDYIRKMIKDSDAYSFEELESLNTELTFTYAQKYFENKNYDLKENNMKNLGIINKDNKYTNLGLIISDQSPYMVKVAVYQNETTIEFKTRKEFTGSVFKIIDDVFDYLEVINQKTSKLVGINRVDNYDYPIYALRETVLNAIVHRDYSYRGGIITNVYTNRIEITSLGGIVSGLTLDDIKNGISETRNINLANLFYRFGLIEAYGTGIKRINEVYKNFSKKPVIAVTQNTFSVVLYNTNENKGITTDKEKILSYIRDNGSISRNEVEQLLQVKKTSALNLLKELVEDNIIEMTEDTKKARYCLK